MMKLDKDKYISALEEWITNHCSNHCWSCQYEKAGRLITGKCRECSVAVTYKKESLWKMNKQILNGCKEKAKSKAGKQ